MVLELPRLNQALQLVDDKKTPSREFSRFWDEAMGKIEATENTQTGLITDLAATQAQQAAILAGGVAFTQLNVNGEVVTTLVTTAGDLGLGNVENKSAADIIAEITGPDVVAALGQGAAVADAAGGAVIDVEARAALNALLARLRIQGVIAT